MSMPMPPQLEAARSQLSALLEQVEKRPVDLSKGSWTEIEKAVVKVLGGAFNPERPEHQLVALGLAAAFGVRLSDSGAFWFPNRETPEGAALGFSDALITLAPFGAVVDALRSARLEKLDDLSKEIRISLGKVKFGGGTPMKLGPEDYMRLFDPGFVQLLALDKEKASRTWNSPPDRLASDLRDGINRAAKLPAEAKQQLEQQLVTALLRMEPGKPLLQQAAKGPRVCEMMGLLFGAAGVSGSAPEEFWVEIVVPLLFIGAPQAFPELGDEEVAAGKQGVDPLFLYLDVVPYTFKAPDEDGLMGVFPGDSLSLPDPAFESVGQLRLITVGTAAVKAALEAFDPQKSKDALARFTAHLRAKTGEVKVANAEEAKQMFEAALMLLEDFKRIVDLGKDVCVRRLTEAEAASEPALALIRQALAGPRIILTS